jgi:membrane-associated protease RseP (regulator of RpoE activity)
MKHLLRPNHSVPFVNHSPIVSLGIAALGIAAAWLSMGPPAAHAQAQELAPIFAEPSPLAIHAAAAGYLGVQVEDIDNDKAQALKLKEIRGAVITLIDHDAPAGQIGLKVNDVVLAINGQTVEGAEALRRMLREIPPGRKISLEISRDGNIQTLAAQLVDRKVMEHDVWNRLLNVEPGSMAPAPPGGLGVFAGIDAMPPGGFHMSLFTSTLNVGAMVEPLTSQMSEYLGVPSGLMVKQVARKSEAAAAGLKAFDVILKVGSDSISTSADWDRALRSNVGKPVQVTILRDKKQQTLTLLVDSKHRSALELEDFFGSGTGADVAELSPLFDEDFANALSAQAAAAAEAVQRQAQELADQIQCQANNETLSAEETENLRQQAEKLRDSMKDFKLDPKQMQQLQQQAEKLRESMKDFKIDPEQMRQQAEKLRESMKDFRIDPKQMDQLRQQMEEFQKNFNSGEMKQFQQQMEKFREQMEQWKQQNCEHCV